MDVIKFKWDTFGKNHHIKGAYFHVFYCLMASAYVCVHYCYHDEEHNLDYVYTALLALSILYPWIYDLIQII